MLNPEVRDIVFILSYRIDYWRDQYFRSNDIGDFRAFLEALSIYDIVTRNQIECSCKTCFYSTALPESEKCRWLNSDSLVFCQKIPQSVEASSECSFYVGQGDNYERKI